MQVKIKQNVDIVGLFCLILHKRMFIIDDLEFIGQRQSLSQKFLTLEQTK